MVFPAVLNVSSLDGQNGFGIDEINHVVVTPIIRPKIESKCGLLVTQTSTKLMQFPSLK